MTSIQRIKEDHLTCTICHELFKKPITLSCLHHFCKQCLLTFTRTKPDIMVKGCFPCATCRQLTNVPEPQRPLDEWPDQLHTGFFVEGLIDALGNSSEENSVSHPESGTESCSPCMEEGDTTSATTWCTDCEIALCARCFRLHQRFKSTLDHIFCDVTDLKTRNKPKLKCMNHPQKRIELYCEDCAVLICSGCSTTVHRQCQSVMTLPEAVPYLKVALEIKSRVTEISTKDISDQISRNKHQADKLTSSLKRAQEDLENITRELLNVVFAKRDILQKQLDQIVNHDLEELTQAIKFDTEIVERNATELKEITTILQSGCDVDVYWEYMKTHTADEPYAKRTSCSVVSHVTFTTELRGIIDQINKYGLGQIVTTTGQTRSESERNSSQSSSSTSWSNSETSSKLLTEPSLKQPKQPALEQMTSEKTREESPVIDKPAKETTTSLKHTLDTKIPSDKREPDINDIIALKVSGVEVIVAADHSNTNLKSFYKQGRKQRHSWLRLEDTPNNMTMTEGNIIAVSVPLLQQIVIVRNTPDLLYQGKINTQKAYNGLVCVNPSTLMAGTNFCVDVINMSGQILKSITKHPNGSRLFTSPYYMCRTAGGLIVITDTGSKRIIFMTEQGKVTAVHSPSGKRRLLCPCGVSSSTNAVFVGDSGSRKVIQLSLQGEYVKDALTSLDGLQSPDGIYAVDDNKVCVGDKRYVKTFHLI